MARRLRAALSLAVAAAIVVLSPGLEAPRLFAQVIVRAAPAGGAAPVLALPAASPMAAPSAFAPSPLASAPSMSLSAPSAFAAAPVAQFAQALAPQLEAAATPGVTASGAAAAGRGIEDTITGQRSAGSGDVAAAVAASEGAGAPALGFAAAAAAPAEAPKAGVPAAAAPAAKSVDSEPSYRIHRFLLKTVAALTGAVFSQPAAGPALTAKLIKSAAAKQAVFSDYDDTEAAYNQVLPQDMVEAVQAIKAAGKDFVVISDRGDEPRAHQLTVFESLASIPAETRAGMYVAANSGGRVYRYDEKGEPVRVFEAPALDEASKAKVAEAAEATKARLKELGAEQHVPSATNNNPSESWGTYGYAMMLKVGSSNDQVRGAADILQAELAKRGLDVEVNPRFAKDPANPPYVNFSIVTKETSSAYIAKALKLSAKDIVVIGDSMYTPHEAKKASWLTRLGEKVSGRALPSTGNRTDANMEKAIPGALTLSVGTTGDPRPSNLWVLAGKGPSVTRQVLMSVASKSRASLQAKKDSAETALHVVGAVSIVAAAAAAYYVIGHAFVDWIQSLEQQLRQNSREFMDGGAMFGGVLAAGGAKAKIPARWKAAAKAVLPAVLIVGAAAAGYYAMITAFGQVFSAGAAQFAPAGVDPLLGMTLGAAGAAGFGAYGAGRKFLANPSDIYGEARKQAVRIAAERGVPADQVMFVRATATLPVRDGSYWDFSFSIPGEKGGRTLIYADAKSFLGGVPEVRTTVYENAPAPGGLEKALEPVHFRMGTKALEPEQALDAARRAQPGMSDRVGIALDYREEPVSGDGDLWYRLFDDKGAIVSVNARTSEARVEAALPSKDSLKASVSPKSPIEGFSTFVYAEALSAARAHAEKIGYAPDNLRVTAAYLSPRAWGEDWTFSFVAPREGYDKEPRAFELSVRRTMVAETLVDAHGVKDLGRAPLFVGFRAADLPAFVQVDPMDVVRKSGNDARTLELRGRWTGPADEPELWYVVRGDKGREIASINAKSGVEAKPDRWAPYRSAATTLGLIALTAGLYAAIYFAITHAPAAQVPEWQQGVPNNVDIGSFFGGTLGLIGLSGTLRSVQGAKKKVTDDEIAAAAKSVVSYKGGIWSQTEYNMGYYNTIENLTKRGATKAQLAAFRKLCDDAPVAGGRFNPWSGD